MIFKFVTQLSSAKLYQLVHYLTHGPDRHVIGPFQSDSNQEVINAFDADTARHRIQNPIWHITLGTAPSDPQLDDATWVRLVDTYLEQLGYGRCLTWIVRHHDAPHPHVHLVVSRIDPVSGKVIPRHHDYIRAALISRALEHQYGLQQLPPPGKGQQGSFLHPDAKSWLRDARWLVDLILQTQPQTLSKFIDTAGSVGLDVQLHTNAQGHLRGVAYQWQGHRFAGSKIQRPWSFLQQHLSLDFDPHVPRKPTVPAPAQPDTSLIAAIHAENQHIQSQPRPSLIQILYGTPLAQLASKIKHSPTQPQPDPERDDDPNPSLRRFK